MHTYTPRPFQTKGINDAISFLKEAKPGDRRFYISPTGSGKSVIELAVLNFMPHSYLISPSEEIINGLLKKGGPRDRIWTPVKLRNALMKGEVPSPEQLIFDEGHHHRADVWQQIELLLGTAPSVAYSATYFRGTPKETKKLHDVWGRAHQLISYVDAIRLGYIKFPNLEIEPLVDDDTIEIENGEFEITRLEAETRGRFGDLIELVSKFYDGEFWDKPTFVSLPSRAMCREFTERCIERGIEMFTVDSNTPTEMRQMIFDATIKRAVAFCHVNIVAEGVDLPLRRLIDAQPIISPVKWLQQFGRITRPTEEETSYVCTNRNLLRHAYLLEGCIPPNVIIDAQKKFEHPSSRAETRVLGLEALGRFKPVYLELASGLRATFYALTTLENNTVQEYGCIIHPLREKPIWGKVMHGIKEDGTKDFGKWIACNPPEDLIGFKSIGPNAVTDKMANWWKRAAGRHGLNADVVPTRKNFQALPMLAGLGIRLL